MIKKVSSGNERYRGFKTSPISFPVPSGVAELTSRFAGVTEPRSPASKG